MSSIARLEVYRNIYPLKGEFSAQADNLRRELLDVEGESVYTSRIDNIVRVTKIPNSRVFPDLRYLHMRVAGENTQRLYKKMDTARGHLEEGKRRVTPPLERALAKVALCHDLGSDKYLWTMTLDEADYEQQVTSKGTKGIVVLKSTNDEFRDTREMLKAMSKETKSMFLRTSSSRIHGMVTDNFVDRVPIAIVDSPDIGKVKSLTEAVRELLPVMVIVDPGIQYQSKH